MKIRLAALWIAPVVLLASTTHAAAKHTTTKTASSTSTAAKSSPAPARRSSAHKGRYVAARHRPVKPSFQTHPTSERYQEIQKALADKGYFKGSADGIWGDDSATALKRFQADNKLDDDGKINSLSLIQLGLGPKHDGSAITTVNPELPLAPPPVTESQPDDQQSTQ